MRTESIRWRNSAHAWGTVARLFHWLMAALIAVQIALGWIAVGWRLSPLKLDLFVWHKSLGVLIFVLVLARLLWRLGNPAPASLPELAAWERNAARVVHGLLYVLMLALPLSGWVISSASNIPFEVLWLFPLPALVAPDEQIAERAAQVHMGLVWMLSLLLILHIGAALRHHYVKRNGVLSGMLTGKEMQS